LELVVPSSDVSILNPCLVEVNGLRPREVAAVTVRCDYGRAPDGSPRVWEATAEQ